MSEPNYSQHAGSPPPPPPPPPPPGGYGHAPSGGIDPALIAALSRGQRRTPWGMILLIAAMLFGGLMFMQAFAMLMAPTEIGIQERTLVRGDPDAKIAILELNGIILDVPGGFLGMGVNPVQTMRDGLDRAAKDTNVKAIVLAINSPGGGITASDILAHELDNFRQATDNRIPVVVLMRDLCASGGYYVAAGADWIIAHPTTITGSIGVLMTNYNVAGLMEKLGIEDTTVTSVDHKATGSMTQPPGPFDEDYFRALITPMQDRFVDVVTDGRQGAFARTLVTDRPHSSLVRAEIVEIADGSVYGAEQALERKLIDEIGYEEDAIDRATSLAGITGEPTVVRYSPAPVTISPVGITVPKENLSSDQASMPGTGIPLDRSSITELMAAAGPRVWVIWLGN